MKKTFKYVTLAAAVVSAMMLFAGTTSYAYSISVTKDSVNVRSTAGTEGSVVATAAKGSSYEVAGEEKDASGKTWYKVTVNGATGYIREDMAAKADATAEAVAAAVETQVTSTDVTPMASQSATVTKDSVNVRSQASTSSNVVKSVKKGDAVTITGSAQGSDGKTWYQVNFINNGSEVSGFIRYDFVEIGESLTVDGSETGEAAPEEGEAYSEDGMSEEEALAEIYGEIETEEPNSDYELVYTADADGNNVWYLYNNIDNKRLKVEDLLRADEINDSNMEIMTAKVAKMKMVSIILAVLFVLAAAVATFLGIRSHDADYDYDDDDDDEDDDDDDDDDDEFEKPRRGFLSRLRGSDDDDDEDDDDDDDYEEPVRRPVRKAAPAEPAQRRPAPKQAPQGAPVRKPAPQGGAQVRRSPQGQGAPVRKPAPQGAPARKPAPGSGQPVRKPAPQQPAAAKSAKDANWKPKNYLTEDDDFEISFIDVDGEE